MTSLISRSLVKLVITYSCLAAESSMAKTSVVAVVQPKEFCQRFSNTMTTLAGQQGMDARGAARAGLRASSNIVSQLKSGKMDLYLDAASFETSVASGGERMWFNIPEILLSSMGVAPNKPVFIEDISELKSTPNVMPGTQVLVLVKEFGDITASRAKLVTQNAQALGVQVNIIWVGGGRRPSDLRLASELALMTNSTGGAFLDFGALNTCTGH
jgi:hypothetical protein